MAQSGNRIKRTVAAWLILASLLFLLSGISPRAVEGTLGMVTHDSVNVRDAAGTVGTQVIAQLSTGHSVTILAETTVGSILWYQITASTSEGMITGWISGDYVRKITPDADYAASLRAQGFPEDYVQKLAAIHDAYPNWVFVAVPVSPSWDEVVAGETVLGRNLTHRNNPDYYINWNDVDANGNLIGRDGYWWVAASSNIVKYYLDPRNFLNAADIFQFESLSYDSTNHTIEAVEKIIGGTFMRSSVTFTVDGTTYTHAQAIMIAAQESGVSPLHLAARLRQEQGTTGSSLSFGEVSGYEGYYNYFNIGAYPTSDASTLENGAKYAKNAGWTDPLKAIVGGAKILARGYINAGQDTVYFQKFDVLSEPYFSHQYMTNISVGVTEASMLRQSYTEEMLQNALVFKIPVYSGMPSSPCSPTGDGEPDPKPDPKPDPEPEPEPEPEPDPDPSVSTGYYVFSGGRVSAVNLGASVEEFLRKVGVQNGSAYVYTAATNLKTAGVMATGDYVGIYNLKGYWHTGYTVVIWGDVNGDGKISAADLLKVRRHLLDEGSLDGWYALAADASGDGKISAADLLKIQRHLLGISAIEQTR